MFAVWKKMPSNKTLKVPAPLICTALFINIFHFSEVFFFGLKESSDKDTKPENPSFIVPKQQATLLSSTLSIFNRIFDGHVHCPDVHVDFYSLNSEK